MSIRTTIIILSVLLSSVTIQAQDVRIALLPGWNQISINVFPPQNMFIDGRIGPDVPRMFELFRIIGEQHPVDLVKDEIGRFYSPRFNFNNIPFWDLQEGMFVLVEEPFALEWAGDRIEPDALIEMISGLNLVAYYPTYRLNAHSNEFYVISDVVDDLIIAKDGLGRFMLPEFDFSNMNPWEHGQSYIIGMQRGDNDQRIEFEFRYPEEREDEDLVIFESGDHWEIPSAGRISMSLLVNDIVGPEGFEPAEGDQIAAFAENGTFTGIGDVHDGVCG